VICLRGVPMWRLGRGVGILRCITWHSVNCNDGTVTEVTSSELRLTLGTTGESFLNLGIDLIWVKSTCTKIAVNTKNKTEQHFSIFSSSVGC
jgi:hypothetical protein